MSYHDYTDRAYDSLSEFNRASPDDELQAQRGHAAQVWATLAVAAAIHELAVVQKENAE